MMPVRTVLTADLALSLTSPPMAAKRPSAKEMLRQQAEHDSCPDAQRLCSDAVPDEARVQACMTAGRAQLGPACSKVFDTADELRTRAA